LNIFSHLLQVEVLVF